MSLPLVALKDNATPTLGWPGDGVLNEPDHLALILTAPSDPGVEWMGEVCKRVRNYCSAGKCTVDTLQQVANAMRIPYPLPDGLWDHDLKDRHVLQWIRWLQRWCQMYTDPTWALQNLHYWPIYEGHVAEVAEWIYKYARRPPDAKEVWHQAMRNSAWIMNVKMFKFFFDHFDEPFQTDMPGIHQWDAVLESGAVNIVLARARMVPVDAPYVAQLLGRFKEVLTLYERLYAENPRFMKPESGIWTSQWTVVHRNIGQVGAACGDLDLLKRSLNVHVEDKTILNDALKTISSIQAVESVEPYIDIVKWIHTSYPATSIIYGGPWMYMLRREWTEPLLLWMAKNVLPLRNTLLRKGSTLHHALNLTVGELRQSKPELMTYLKSIGVTNW